MKAKGKYVIKVCRGTACHVKGSKSILGVMKKELHLNEGETTPDYRFTLETAACLGACALAPTMMVNKTYFGKLSPPKVSSTLAEYGKAEVKEEGRKTKDEGGRRRADGSDWRFTRLLFVEPGMI